MRIAVRANKRKEDFDGFIPMQLLFAIASIDFRDDRSAAAGRSPAGTIFAGKPVYGTDNDLFALAERLAASTGPAPRLLQCCGTEDFLYEDNRKFLAHAGALGLNIEYEEEPGDHNWGYWDLKIQRVIEWLPIGNSNP